MCVLLRILLFSVKIVLIVLCCRHIRRIAKKTMYSYKIVSLIGLIIFFGGLIFNDATIFITIIQYSEYPYEFYSFYSDIVLVFTSFSYLAFPFILLFSTFLVASSVVLLIKEGKSLTNILGLIFSIVLSFGTYLLINLYYMLENIFDVHSFAGHHITLALENIISIFLTYFECMMIATIFVAIKSARHKIKTSKDYVIVLGCRVLNDGMPGGTLRKRVDAALKFANEQHNDFGHYPTLIFSGGKGNDEPVSEAESMHRYAVSRHYKGKMILENQSKTTRQNFLFSKKLIEPDKEIAFATTDFHVFRSGVIAVSNGISNIEGINAKSPWYFYSNSLIREFIANLNTERKMHIFNVVTLNIIMTIMIILSYYLNIL